MRSVMFVLATALASCCAAMPVNGKVASAPKSAKTDPLHRNWKKDNWYSHHLSTIRESVMEADVVDRGSDIVDRDADANVVYPDAYIESRGLEIVDRDADANVVYPDAYIESRGVDIVDRDADANVVYPDAYIEE